MGINDWDITERATFPAFRLCNMLKVPSYSSCPIVGGGGGKILIIVLDIYVNNHRQVCTITITKDTFKLVKEMRCVGMHVSVQYCKYCSKGCCKLSESRRGKQNIQVNCCRNWHVLCRPCRSNKGLIESITKSGCSVVFGIAAKV